MDFLNALTHNIVFMSAVTGWFVAQVLKTLIYTCINRSFDPERLVGSGGMPSSHSATVCALATAAGIRYGGASFEFAISAILAIIVMYDARGVRRETGLQAQVLNEMITFWEKMGQPLTYEERLKEFVGHTPLQVFAGALLGILIAFLYCFSIG
ncbi:MAG: divergent PAP2 family protein [Eubacteriales bacterium]|nr:divergent PAP2 family protein [Eubacteriales bacterium]